MAGNISRVNLTQAAEAMKEFLEDEATMHQQFLEELAARNQGRLNEYVSRNKSLWSRLLGRLRESGVDAPETLLGSAAVVVVGVALSMALASRKRM